jgi:hypothetical protein
MVAVPTRPLPFWESITRRLSGRETFSALSGSRLIGRTHCGDDDEQGAGPGAGTPWPTATARPLPLVESVVPAIGTALQLLNNQGAGAVSGIFTGQPEGSTFLVKSGSTTMTFKITYIGETGNDVVITRIS